MHARVEHTFSWLEEDPRPLDWNGPADRLFTRFRDQDLNRPVIEHFEQIVRRHRAGIAIRDADTAVSFGELWDGVSGLAEMLAADTRPGELVGILLPAGPMFPLAILACLAAGHPFVVLDTHWPTDWLDFVLRDARPTLIVTQEDGGPGLETRGPGPRVIRLTGFPKAARKSWRPANMAVDEPACVLFTSGSTGRPKSIVNSQRNLLQRVVQSTNAAHINSADRFLTLASPCTIVGVRDVLTALLCGASIHLLDPQGVGAREILNVIRGEAITILFAFPALLRSVVAARGERAAALRLVRVGGDTTLWSDIGLLRQWLAPAASIQVIYAATEAPMMQWFVDDSCRRDDARVPIGYPLPGNRLALIDEDGRATASGEVGELVVASAYVSLGNWVEGRCADGSVETGGRGIRLFRTGDLVRQRPDGMLERVGRKDRQVKIRGTRVDIDGIEAMLRGHALVRDAAAVARTSSIDGTVTIVAYVSAHDHASGGLIEELKALMRSAPPPMHPARFYLVKEIPRLASSKLNTRALAALDEINLRTERAEPADDAQLAPITGDHIAQTVAHCWRQVLRAPVRGLEDDFFDSGGDSLNAMLFLAELERALGLELPLTLINEAPQFGQLCEALRERRSPLSSLLVPLKAGDGSPALFFIHGIGGNVVEILPTARRVSYPGAVIGIRARGVVPGEAPHTSVKAMAADYLQEIKARQPQGPYHLCGYSFGGLVAFELAARLLESGDEVGLVGLFDTTMSPVRWPLRVWPSIIGWHLSRSVAALRAARLRTWLAELRKKRARISEAHGDAAPTPPLAIRVRTTTLIASAKFQPRFYDGSVTLFTPAERAPGFPSLESIWRKHARTIALIETSGTHQTMLSGPNAESTAAALTRCLLAARSG